MGKVVGLAMAVAVIAIIGFFSHDAYTVSLNGTTSTVTPNPATAVLGAPITLHVKVVDTSATKIIATGIVSWSDGGAGGVFSNSGSCTLAPVSGSTSSATCSIVYTAPSNSSPVTITANYLGDSNHQTSSGTSALTVTLRATKTTISPNPASTAIGKPITFNVKVLDSSSGTKSIPTGTVSWSDGGAGGTFSSSSCTLSQYSTSTSTSICAIAYTPPSNTGPVTITATYSGDSTHKTSSGTSALTVTLRAVRTSILTSPVGISSIPSGTNIVLQGKALDFGVGTQSIPTGTLSWSDGGAGGSFSSSSCTLAGFPPNGAFNQGACKVTYTSPITPGTVTITATYSGDSIHSTSSGKLSLTVT